jgi:hypothetical protein
LIIGQGLQYHHRVPLGAFHLGGETQGMENLDDLDQRLQRPLDTLDMDGHLL